MYAKKRSKVMNGMSASATELHKYVSYWDKYKNIWENDKVRELGVPKTE